MTRAAMAQSHRGIVEHGAAAGGHDGCTGGFLSQQPTLKAKALQHGETQRINHIRTVFRSGA